MSIKGTFDYTGSSTCSPQNYILADSWNEKTFMDDDGRALKIACIEGDIWGEHKLLWKVEPNSEHEGDKAAIAYFKVRTYPSRKDRIIELLQAERQQLVYQQTALDDLAAAIVTTRHHKQPGEGNIKKAMKAVNGEKWWLWLTKPDNDWSQWEIHISGKPLDSKHNLTIYCGKREDFTWDKIFESIKHHDTARQIGCIDFNLEKLDELIEAEDEIRETVCKFKKKLADNLGDNSLHSIVRERLPALDLRAPDRVA